MIKELRHESRENSRPYGQDGRHLEAISAHK